MKDTNIRKLVLAALFAALCTIMTLVIQVPSPMQGYVNLGDCAVLMAAWTLGPIYGGAAAGIGSMLADLLSGYAYYAPGTLVIKLVMAVAAGLIFRFLQRRAASHLLVSQAVSGVVAESIMVVGYFGYAALWLGNGLGAAASIPGNVAQGVFGLAAAAVVYAMLNRSRVLSRI
ncbi:MAG: ECF transporter S component [Lawsonibacter sp.]